jgi:hypothetical protein
MRYGNLGERQLGGPFGFVNVAAHGDYGCQVPKSIENFGSSHIPRMDDEVRATQRAESLFA